MKAAVDLDDSVGDALNDVVEFVPKLIGFLLILLVGWIVARVLAKVTNAVLERVGFDKAVERGGVGAALARSQYDASDLVAKLVYYTVLLIALIMAFDLFGPNPVSDLLADLVAWLPRLVVAIIIVVVASAVAKAVKDLMTAALGGLSYGATLANIASIFILALGIIAALNQVGIATTVTTPVLVAVLATIGGILVVGVGGGLVRPMQQRWEQWLQRAEQEAPRVKEEASRRSGGPSASTVEPAAATQAFPVSSGTSTTVESGGSPAEGQRL